VKRKEIISKWMSEVARQRHARLTPEERTAAASKAAVGRWSKMTAEERSEQARERWRKIKRRQRKAKVMADETDKHTPESVAAKVVKALLKAPPAEGGKRGERRRRSKKESVRGQRQKG
jgi:acyl-CoA reductase-like NAD-dependent aldehyde dehydrogenase